MFGALITLTVTSCSPTYRLASILQKRTMAAAKLDEIKIKANILAAFAEEKAKDAAEAVEDAARSLKEEL